MAQQGLAAVDHGDLGAEAIEYVGKFHGDIAAADDDQAFWLAVHPHDVFVGVVLHTGIGVDLRDYRAGAGSNNDLIGADDVIAGLDGLRADEASVLVVDGDIRGLVAATVVLAALGDLVDAVVEDALHNGVPLHVVDLGVNAEALAFAGGEGDIGCVDVHLGGDAADIQAGATEAALFNDGNLLIVKIAVGNGVAGTGANDDEVVVFLSGRSICCINCGHINTLIHVSNLGIYAGVGASTMVGSHASHAANASSKGRGRDKKTSWRAPSMECSV